MNVYLLGSKVSNVSLADLLSKWNIQKIETEVELKNTLNQETGRTSHFIMEVSEINEKKYNELKALASRYGQKARFIVFYQTLKAAPVISKLHGSEILLIGPEERSITNHLLKRFLHNPNPLFRRWQRYQMLTSGSLSLLSDSQAGFKVSILDFGPHGARIQISGVDFNKKDFVVLEYISHDGKKIRMQSRVSWIKSAAQSLQSAAEAGIQFISREV